MYIAAVDFSFIHIDSGVNKLGGRVIGVYNPPRPKIKYLYFIYQIRQRRKKRNHFFFTYQIVHSLIHHQFFFLSIIHL